MVSHDILDFYDRMAANVYTRENGDYCVKEIPFADYREEILQRLPGF